VTDVIRLPAKGGAETLIAHTSGARLVDFTPDGQRVRYYGPDGLSFGRLDGTDLPQRADRARPAASKYVGTPIPVEELRLNPSGDRALRVPLRNSTCWKYRHGRMTNQPKSI